MADTNDNAQNSVNKPAVTKSYDNLRSESQINRHDLLHESLITPCCENIFSQSIGKNRKGLAAIYIYHVQPLYICIKNKSAFLNNVSGQEVRNV